MRMQVAPRWIFMLGLAVAVPSCANSRMMQLQDARSNMVADMKICDQVHPEKPVIERVKCKNEAIIRYQNSIASLNVGQNVDLANLLTAKQVAIAEQYDSGQITETQYQVAMAQVASEFHTEAQRRGKEAAMVTAAQAQAAAANRVYTCNTSGTTFGGSYGGTTTCY